MKDCQNSGKLQIEYYLKKGSVDPNQHSDQCPSDQRPSSCLLCYKISQLWINGRHSSGRVKKEEL